MAHQQRRPEPRTDGPPVRFAQQCRPDAAVLQPGKHRQRSDAQHGRGTPVLRDDLQPGQQHVPHEAALRLGHERQSGDERLRTAQARHQQVFRMVAERQRPERRLDQLPDRPAIVRPLLPYRQFHAGFVCTDPGQAAPDAPRKPAAHRTPPPGVSVSCRI